MSVQQINWRSEFDALKPYIEKKGGVVHIRYRGEACAPRAFLATLKSTVEGHGTSIRIDPEFFTTHYLGDVLHELATKLGHALEIEKPAGPAIEEMVIASGNESDGDMEITANVHMHGGDPAGASVLRDHRVAAICQAMRKYLVTARFMIVLNATPAHEQSSFWRDLWAKGLGALVKDGLVLVKMIDEENNDQGRHPDEPPPEQVLSLPVEFDEARQRDAIEDLARILASQVKFQRNLEVSLDSATQSVRAFVYSHKRSIDRLHNEWSGVLMELVRDAR